LGWATVQAFGGQESGNLKRRPSERVVKVWCAFALLMMNCLQNQIDLQYKQVVGDHSCFFSWSLLGASLVMEALMVTPLAMPMVTWWWSRRAARVNGSGDLVAGG
jgi:hypothetical protein